MRAAALRDLAALVRGSVVFDEPLASYTTYRIGGPASALVQPRSVNDVAATVRFARETGTRWLALGLGSNVLIGDQGFDGIVIRLGKGLDQVRPESGTRWRVGAGHPTPLLARRSAAAGLGGVDLLIGVPGTVGGGVYMNAGAHGQDFSQVVRSVELVDADGELRVIPASAVRWRYRESGLDGNVVVGATIELHPQDPEQLKNGVRRHLKWRKEGTPFNEPCCGSVFRNPSAPATAAAAEKRRTAGQLIDAAGMKGFTIGRAQVSPMHANYIVNLGGATASDVLGVIEAVRERVRREFGIELELEVKIIQ